MNKRKMSLVIGIPTIIIIIISGHLYWLSSLKGNETYPQDTFLDGVSNKTALIVVAHDDDAIGCAGTISELISKGWSVHFLTFYGRWREHDNPIRKKEVEHVARIQELASINLIDFSLQKSDTVKEPWRPIPYSRFREYMHVDSLKTIIATCIEKYKPSVLFTLDDVIGGYGHPEHVCISQIVLDICEENKVNKVFSVEKIYQAVFPKTLNENILKNNPAFIAAKAVYKAEGSPIPTVEINIYNSSKKKKQVMLAYESQKRNLIKIWPNYDLYPHWLYFKIFDKEYFRDITITRN
jgi:LmbE family N-acetylglucosaminyl deacetylase